MPVLMMCALKVARSTIAATSRGSPNTLPHSAERKVGPDPDRGVFVSLGDDLEQQFGAARLDLHVAESCRAAAGTAELRGEGVDAGLRRPVRSRVPGAVLVRSEKAPARGLSRRPISRPGASGPSRSTWRTRSKLSRTP